MKIIQEKEYELSEVFHLRRDSVSSGSVLAMTQVNKYSYQVNDNSSVVDNSIVTFVPSYSTTTTERTAADTTKDKIHDVEPKISNEIPDPDMTAAVKFRHHRKDKESRRRGPVKSFRSGYHASTGPTDFLKKKYKSEFIKVPISKTAYYIAK
ncbi:MAG TPA: hypothetical protein EYQ00_01130 [Dehalococcoidia bacterium]|nr:hypothetical protein [Dehalococcoidia bacterium]